MKLNLILLCLNIMTVYRTYKDDPVRQAEGALPQQNTKTGQAAGAHTENRGSCGQVLLVVCRIQLSPEKAKSSGMKKTPYCK
jgi:hypothetical protein